MSIDQDCIFPSFYLLCKRLFSKAKLIIRDVRKHMDPSKMETIICLRLDKDLWDAATVETCMKRANVAYRATIIAVPVLTSNAISTPPTHNEQARQRTRKRGRQSDDEDSSSDD